MTTSSTPRFNRLLLTGAAGGLGKVLRETLRPYAEVLRLSDIAAMAPAAGPHEETKELGGDRQKLIEAMQKEIYAKMDPSTYGM